MANKCFPSPSFYGEPNSTTHQKRGYFEGVRKNLEAISSFYNSSWSVRLYHDIGPDDPLMVDLCKLACSNNRLDLCPVDQLPPHHLLANAVNMFPMLWRFFPTLDSQVDIFMSRDLDSIVKLREVEAVEEWLQSGKSLHVMRDNTHHKVDMLGGLWGAQLTRSRKVWKEDWENIWTAIIADPLSRVGRKAKNGPDQTLLSRHVWGKFSVLQHDSFSCPKYPGAVGFPSQRQTSTWNFVGASPESNRPENIPCPTQCRRNQSWKFC